jgi:hypothetical protein
VTILSQIGPLQWQVPIVDDEGRPTPEFTRYFQQLFGNTTALDGGKQDSSAILTALAALVGTGFITQTGANTFAERTLTAGTGISISNGNGVSGNPVISTSVGGIASVPIVAAAMTPNTTNGAVATLLETTTNKIMLNTLDFDQSTLQSAQIAVPMPKSWDEGTVTVQFIWTATAGTGNVIWGVKAVAISDGDVIDTAFGTAQTVTDTLIATGDQHETTFTSALTVAGSPVNNDVVYFYFYRDAANGSDTLTASAKLIGVRINVTINAADDS